MSSQKTIDDRDFANVTRAIASASGRRSFIPEYIAYPSTVQCECRYDPVSRTRSCVCGPVVTADILFGSDDDRASHRRVPRVIVSSPCERSEAKKKQRIIAQSIA